MYITLLIDSLSLTKLYAHHEVRAVFRLLFLCTSWNWFSSPVRLIFTVDFHVMKAVLCCLFPIFICQSLQMLHVWLLLLHPAFDVCSLIGNCTFRCLSLLSSQSSSMASTLQNVTIIIALLKDFCQLTLHFGHLPRAMSSLPFFSSHCHFLPNYFRVTWCSRGSFI